MARWCHRSANCAAIPPDGSTVSSDHMAWLILSVLALVGLAAAVMVPRRARLGSAPGFPWFWVAFPRHMHRHRDRDRRLRLASSIDRLGKLLVAAAHCESTRSAVLVERAVPAVRDTAPVEMGATGGIPRGNRVVRVGLAAPPDVTPLWPKIVQDTPGIPESAGTSRRLCPSGGVFGGGVMHRRVGGRRFVTGQSAE